MTYKLQCEQIRLKGLGTACLPSIWGNKSKAKKPCSAEALRAQETEVGPCSVPYLLVLDKIYFDPLCFFSGVKLWISVGPNVHSFEILTTW